MNFTIFEDGHIASPTGFRATGVAAGLKEGSKARDLALVYSQYPCRAAALFTTSVFKAAPVFLSQAILLRNHDAIRAVLINAGQANAGTGQSGLNDAIECAKITADELEVPRDSVLLMSTGLIGVPLPMQRMRNGIRRAVSELDSNGGRRAALAILTTDTRPKERVLRVTLRNGPRFTLAGMAKGTRMIHPRLATMLALITTDLAISQPLLQRALHQSVERSFNRLNIDGDCSPNDSVIMLANGAIDHPPITDSSTWEFGVFQEALDFLCADLAGQIVRDAAGSGKVIKVVVQGAADEVTASAIAHTVARSGSVRAACRRHSSDWGALLAAIGASNVELRPDLLDLRIGTVPVMLRGAPIPFDPTMLMQTMSGPEIELLIDLNLGPAETTVWTCTWTDE
ncbi:bifunctional glutamate N-acetyltransferase/amino-acid acetyltransferase ArgJ [Chloroflexus sp.]|uniref:bifunctional glutamate N-acetyltransferase/amino-acid acetyltransferase ArgJ n=1 Tax=Chloroflexus sp. TaxID=1904827 RepID=UPI004049702E